MCRARIAIAVRDGRSPAFRAEWYTGRPTGQQGRITPPLANRRLLNASAFSNRSRRPRCSGLFREKLQPIPLLFLADFTAHDDRLNAA